MKVSLNWAQYYSNVDIKSAGADEIVRRIGAQLGSVEEVTGWSSRYEGIYVVKIVAVEKHPDADKLHICLVDDNGVVKNVKRNEDGYVQIVCGAPKVEVGMVVAWITPGSTVPVTVDKDPFVLEIRNIRGIDSPGMLSTAQELGISDDTSGLLELQNEPSLENIKLGSLLRDAIGLHNETVIDCENKMFTHRPDCFGILGVARELAGIQGLKFESPEWYVKAIKPETVEELPLDIRVEVPDLVPRFMAVAITGLKVGPSPVWMQSYLKRVGIKSINNIVDLTNYFMQLTGQPMHAFDYDKIKARCKGDAVITARLAEDGEDLTLLGGKQIKLTSKDIVLATDKQAVDIAGIMGGAETEVDRDTKSIILTCASFDMYAIRRSTMRHGVFTDASTRYTKGQSIYQNDRVLYKIVTEIIATGGKVASEYFDVRGELPKMQSVKVTASFINERLGSDLTADEMKQLLENVEFVVRITGDELTVNHPFWRTDIEIPEDIVEEIGRLHGFDKLPVVLPSKQIEPATLNHTIELKNKLRQILSSAGANELLTYSFVHGDLLESAGQSRIDAYELGNALSPDLQYYRLSLVPSLLDKVHANIKAGHGHFAIFEIGKSHNKKEQGDDKLPKESENIGLVFVADDKTAKSEHQGAAYYEVRLYLQHMLMRLGLTCKYQSIAEAENLTAFEEQTIKPFDPERSAFVVDKKGKRLGVIGELRSSVRRKLKLPAFTAAFELDTQKLLELSGLNKYQPLNKFPSSTQDITVKVDSGMSYGEVFDAIWSVLDSAESDHGYDAVLSPVDIYSPDNQTNNYTFRLVVAHPEKTLVTEEVNSLMNKISAELQSKLDATRI